MFVISRKTKKVLYSDNSNNREAIIAKSRVNLGPWKTPLYGPLSPLQPSVSSTALHPFLGPSAPLSGPLYLLQPIIPATAPCLLHDTHTKQHITKTE